MASKFTTKIKLRQKDEEGKYGLKQYTSAEFLPGSVMVDAAEVQAKMVEANSADAIREALNDTYEFIASVLFEGQFTAEEYRDGLDAREISKITGKLLMSVTAGYDKTYSDSKKK